MPEYSFILAGRVGVGKSSLFAELKRKGQLDTECSEDTGTLRRYDDLGLENHIYETSTNDREIKVTLWDTGGLERYDSMTANYYRHAHAVILVYDLEAEDTLYCLADWIAEARSSSRWSDRLVFALWGNKCDVEEYATSEDAVVAFAAKYNIPSDLTFKVSSRIAGNVEAAFERVIELVDVEFSKLGGELDISAEARDTSRLTFSLEASPKSRLPACCGRS